MPLKYGNNANEDAFDHAHTAVMVPCKLCSNSGEYSHHFSVLSEDQCYWLCERHESEHFGTRT